MQENKQQPIRILQVFAGMNKGGAETMIMTYYRNIDRSKIQFDFIVHTDKECAFDKEIEKLGGKIFRFPRYIILNHFSYQRKWKQFLLQHPEYKIIHGHFFTISAIYFQVAKRLGETCIAHSHISKLFNNTLIERIKFNLFIEPLRNLAHYHLACSTDAGEWMYGKSILKERTFFVMNNAIDAGKFVFDSHARDKIRDELNLKDKFVVGHIARFTYQKNHVFLIDIFHEIIKQKPNAILLLVGDGDLKDEIIKKVERLNLQHAVLFTGVRNDIPQLLSAMDIFLFPSRYEGLGIVLIEAQTSGLKSFTSANVVPLEAKVTDLLHFVPLSEGAKAWSDQICAMGASYERCNRYDEIKENGYDILTNITWLEQFYLSIK